MIKLHRLLLFSFFLMMNYKAGGSQSKAVDCCHTKVRYDFKGHKTLESIFINNLHVNVQSFFIVLQTLDVSSKFEAINSITDASFESFIENEFYNGFLLYFSKLLVNDINFISCKYDNAFYFYDKFEYDHDHQSRFKVMITYQADTFINLVYQNLYKSVRLRQFILQKFKSDFFKKAMINYCVDSNNMFNECPRFDYLDFEMKSEEFLPIEKFFSDLFLNKTFVETHVKYLFNEKNTKKNKDSSEVAKVIYNYNFDNAYDGFMFLLCSLFYFYKDNASKPFNLSLIEGYLKEYLDIWSQCVVVFLYNQLDALNKYSVFYNFIDEYDFQYHGSGDKEKFVIAINNLKFAAQKRSFLIKKCGIQKADWYINGWQTILRKDKNYEIFFTRRYQEIFFHEKIFFDTLNEYDEYIRIYRSLNWDQLYNNIDKKVKYFFKKICNSDKIDISKQKTYEVCEFLSAVVNSFMQTYIWKFSNNFKTHAIDDGLCPKVWQTCSDRENIIVSEYQNKLCVTIPFAKMINSAKNYNYNYDSDVLNHGFLIVFFTYRLFFNDSNVPEQNNSNLNQKHKRAANLTVKNVQNFVKTNKNNKNNTNKEDNIAHFNSFNFLRSINLEYLKIAESFYEYLFTKQNDGKIDLLSQFVSIDMFAIRERFFKFFKKNCCDKDNHLKPDYENGVFRSIYEYCIYSLLQLGDKRFKSSNQISQRFIRLDVPQKGSEKQVFIYFLVNRFFHWVQYFSFVEYAVFVSPSLVDAVLSYIPETNHIVCPTFAL